MGLLSELKRRYDDVGRFRDAGRVGREYTNRNYQKGLVAYLDVQRQMGLKLIAEVAEQNVYIWPSEASLQDLYDDTGFEPTREAQEDHHARERDRILAIACNENPWADIWQPREETCEQFYSAAGR
jgi:hypothetical protein